MRTNRIAKWGVVLLLLAALPGLTVAMAQGATPVPTAGEDVTCTVMEAFPDDHGENGPQQPIGLNEVVCGTIYDGDGGCRENQDDDKFTFVMPEDGYILINEFSDGNFHVCYQSLLHPWYSCTLRPGMTDTPTNMVYQGLPAGTYEILVFGGPEATCPGQYKFTVSTPVLVSAAAKGLTAGGDVAGIHFYAEDILANMQLAGGQEQWVMLFDGSDVGVTRNVSNIAAGKFGQMMLSLGNGQELPELGAVTASDIVVFDVGTLDVVGGRGGFGPNTVGEFRQGLVGAEHDLTTPGETLDAIDGWVNGTDRCYGFPMSTAKVATVTGWLGEMQQDNNDVFCKVYDELAGGFRPYDWFFDVRGQHSAPASEPRPGKVPGLPKENVVGMAYDDADDVMYLTIAGTGSVWGNAVTQQDIFAINYPDYTWGGIAWHGPDHGWNYAIDAFDWPMD